MTSSPKRKRTLAVRDMIKEDDITPEFKVIDGLRYVVPYHFKFRVHAKKRWFDRSILEVFTEEFQSYTAEYYRAALSSGKITVNSKTVQPDYRLKDSDFLTHSIHRHEPPVLDTNIEIIAETDDILAVNKPASFPVHTTGRFRHNTLLSTLEQQLGYKLYTCHRLDRLTSGIIVLLKKSAKAKQFAALFRDHAVKKTYLALCSGEFPAAPFTCSEPIQCVCNKLGICEVNWELGKPAQTTFTRLHYNTATHRSVVLCEPTTGRMHQIRVHLAHHGHPIPNDPIYARENWAKKSSAEFSRELSNALYATDNVTHNISAANDSDLSVSGDGIKSTTDLLVSGDGIKSTTDLLVSGDGIKSTTDLLVSGDGIKSTTDLLVSGDGIKSTPDLLVSGDGIKSTTDITITPSGDFLLAGKLHKPIPQLSVDAACPECRVTRLAPHADDMFIYLHALRYQLDGNVFVSKLPEWCSEQCIPHNLL